jgi:hypothetical protein
MKEGKKSKHVHHGIVYRIEVMIKWAAEHKFIKVNANDLHK